MKKLVLSILAIIAGCFASSADLWIIGDATDFGWNLARPENSKLTQSGDIYTWEGNMKDGNFRFISQGDWWNQSYSVNGEKNLDVQEGEYDILYYETKASYGEPSFHLTVPGRYKITLNLTTNKMNLKLLETVLDTDLWLVGAATPAGWDTNNSKRQKMEKNGRTYTWTGPLTKFGDGRFIFLAKEGEWNPRYTNNSDNNCLQMSVGQSYDLKRFEGNADNPAFGVEKPGIYTVTVTLGDDLQTGSVSIEEAAICIIGPAISGKWEYNDIARNEFTSDGNGRYTFTGNVTLNSDNANDAGKFRINQKGKWSPAFFPVEGGTELIPEEGGSFEARWYTSDNVPHFKVSAEGNYTFVLDLTTDNDNQKPKLTVTRNGGTEPEKPLTALYICGHAIVKDGSANWDLNDKYIQPMTATENPGEFTWTGDMYKDGQFKFRLNSHESGDWTGFVATEADKAVETGVKLTILPSSGNNDYKFVVPEDGNYTVTANTYGDDKYITVEKLGVSGITGITGNTAAVIINGRDITVSCKADVFDIMGRSVATITAGNSATLPAAGIYVVVSGGKATRIAVK